MNEYLSSFTTFSLAIVILYLWYLTDNTRQWLFCLRIRTKKIKTTISYRKATRRLQCIWSWTRLISELPVPHVKVSLWQKIVSWHSNFETDQTNSVSYERWHLQLKFETLLMLLRLILRRYPKWPRSKWKKSEAKILESPIFDLQKRNTCVQICTYSKLYNCI